MFCTLLNKLYSIFTNKLDFPKAFDAFPIQYLYNIDKRGHTNVIFSVKVTFYATYIRKPPSLGLNRL